MTPPDRRTTLRRALDQAIPLACLLSVLFGFWFLVFLKAVHVAESENQADTAIIR